jgi:hypothetical protein
VTWHPGLFYIAVCVLLISSAGVLYALESNTVWVAMLSAVGMLVAGILFLLSIFLPLRKKVDWERVQAEQRLWESGPLGKAWLKTRKRLYRLWKW